MKFVSNIVRVLYVLHYWFAPLGYSAKLSDGRGKTEGVLLTCHTLWAAAVTRRPPRFLPSSKQPCVTFYTKKPTTNLRRCLAPWEKRTNYSPPCVIGVGRSLQPTSVLSICSAQSLVARRSAAFATVCEHL